ncbi:MAG: hypothetical protein PHX70_00730 [Clostridium sp.]|nr:hypothetical protein [Clostridium sp.]
MGEILLNSGELNQCASQVQQLINEVLNMQNEVKSTVNELDSNNAGRSARYASNVMYSCYGKGQKVNAGLVEIKQIVSEAVRRFAELDRDTAGSMVKICTDPEHARAFFNKEQSKIKKEINSDFVEYKKEARNTEEKIFKREEPKTLSWDDIKGAVKSILSAVTSKKGIAIISAIATIGFGVLTVASGGFIALAAAAFIFGVSDLIEAASADKNDEGGFNPLKTGLSNITKGIGNHMGFEGGGKVGDAIYNASDGGIAVASLVLNPAEEASKAGTVAKTAEEINSAIKGGEVLTRSEKAINVVKGVATKASEYKGLFDGDWNVFKTKSGVRELSNSLDEFKNGNSISAMNSIKESVSPVAQFSSRCLKNSFTNESLMDTFKLGKTYVGDMKAAFARGYERSTAYSFASGLADTTKGAAALNDIYGIHSSYEGIKKDWK